MKNGREDEPERVVHLSGTEDPALLYRVKQCVRADAGKKRTVRTPPLPVRRKIFRRFRGEILPVRSQGVS